MTNRETMQALLAGEQPAVTPQWLMAFAGRPLVERLIPADLLYDGYHLYPEETYPFAAMGPERLAAEQRFNAHIDRCAFPVGWGANAAFGHGGPGEFNARVIAREPGRIVVEYETGARKEVRLDPHNVRTFDLPVEEERDLARLRLPDPRDPARWAGLAEDVAWAKAHGEWTIGWVNGFFSGVHYFLRDYTEFFVDLALRPAFARALIGTVGEWTLAAAEELCRAGVDAIGLCDDLGSEKAMLISPAMAREFVLPWHRRLCDLAHAHGVAVHLHSHGAIRPILPDLAAVGIDMLNPLDPDDGMPLAAAREALGPRVVLCGGMDKHFWDWSAERKAEHLRQVVREGRRLGPHILMDSAGLPENVTRGAFEEFLRMSRRARGEET